MNRSSLVLAAIVVGCGGKAIVDGQPGSGGSGSGGKSPTAGTGAGSGTASASVVTVTAVGVTAGQTGPSFNGCAPVCSAVNSTCGTVANCQDKCNSVKASCRDAHQAWLLCLLNKGIGASGCKLVTGCETAIDKYISCIGPNCGVAGCGAGHDGSCGCNGKCDGVAYQTKCSPTPDGLLACNCAVNGIPAGKCLGPNNFPTCEITHGCCAPLFFVDG